MDLSFARLSSSSATPLRAAMPVDLTVLLVGMKERQDASATAQLQAAMSPAVSAQVRLASVDGAFCATTAAVLRRWKGP